MLLRLEDAQVDPLPWQEDVTVSADELGRDDLLDLSTIETRGELRAIEGGYLLTGELDYEQSIACTRCLEPARESVKSSFEAFLVPGLSEEAAEEVELDADDLSVVPIEGETVETEEFVREQIVLQLPQKALCQKACAGLCPQCGQNLNQGSCSCEGPTDPRWAALAALKESANQ